MVDNARSLDRRTDTGHLDGGGWFHGPVAVDGFETVSDDEDWACCATIDSNCGSPHRPLPVHGPRSASP